MAELAVGIVVVSDSCAKDASRDSTGPALAKSIESAGGYKVAGVTIVPDDKLRIAQAVLEHKHCQLVLTAGGTGFSPSDVTPEVSKVIVKCSSRF